jgi:hypothetical protein
MRRINSVGVVLASALFLVAGFGSAAPLEQVSPPSNEVAVQQPGAEPGASVVAAAEGEQAPSGGVEERGGPKIREGLGVPGPPRKALPPPPAKPGGGLPAKLCHEVTHMVTQCRCANSTDCQVLSTLCPGSCPAGSQSCQCTPLFRGTPPPLPQNLCGYQVPWTTTQCSCDNQADCQVLSTVCPGSCPPGSQSCQCTPLQRR